MKLICKCKSCGSENLNLTGKVNLLKQEIICNDCQRYMGVKLNKDVGFVNTREGDISDGYHTFDELYFHRKELFRFITKLFPMNSWKSKLHYDGTMYQNYFIVGIVTPEGDYTYHYHLDYWDEFDVKILERAPKYDGHKPEDICRIFSLVNDLSVSLLGYATEIASRVNEDTFNAITKYINNELK